LFQKVLMLRLGQLHTETPHGPRATSAAHDHDTTHDLSATGDNIKTFQLQLAIFTLQALSSGEVDTVQVGLLLQA